MFAGGDMSVWSRDGCGRMRHKLVGESDVRGLLEKWWLCPPGQMAWAHSGSSGAVYPLRLCIAVSLLSTLSMSLERRTREILGKRIASLVVARVGEC